MRHTNCNKSNTKQTNKKSSNKHIKRYTTDTRQTNQVPKYKFAHTHARKADKYVELSYPESYFHQEARVVREDRERQNDVALSTQVSHSLEYSLAYSLTYRIIHHS